LYEILTLILPLFGLIVIGFATARITKRPLDEMGWLNIFIIYVALPALFFKLLSKTPVEELASWAFIGTNIGVTFAVFVLSFGLGLIASGRRVGDATVQGLAGAYGNIGYMGPALAILAFGEQAAVPVALIFCFENVLHFVNAPALMAVSGERKGNPGAVALDVLRSIAFHPFIIATIVGVGAAFIGIAPPAPIENLIAYLAQAAAPCALFAMGATLALRPLRRVPVELGYLIPMKLIVHPVAMYLALSYVGNFDDVWVFTAVLLAALPTATNVFVIAQQYEVWVERASATILMTTIFSVFTVSALLYGIKTGAMPPDLFP
jgi:predicted permease